MRRGFTLIEMAIVIAVLVILAAITVAIGSNVVSSWRVKSTKTELIAIRDVANEFRAQYAPFRPNENQDYGWFETLRTTGLAKGLQSYPVEERGGHMYILDGFGRHIRCVISPSLTYLQSAGPNGVYGDADDITEMVN
jgi:prepilin-type N-terminal cleavage/methylation domain-containing protein